MTSYGKAHGSYLEFQVEDQLEALYPGYKAIKVKDPLWEVFEPIFWTCMQLGNYDLALAEDDNEEM